MQNKTFAIIKPDAVESNNLGKIIDIIIKNEFTILNARLITMSVSQAEGFYAIHKERPFFHDLVSFMCSGPCMVLELEKPNAVKEWRSLIGSTDPNEADDGTIRKDFAESKERNSVHGSDSDENASIEINYFFKNEI
ncbi:MAG: nucleoside-diphosphate kinase [Candidatus Marinimicrobia bacterium]|nr:nucleoside-diphosphate kinase [Candidatus Neomarinimicrobiota bacterium]|tara:strand:- start:794 stop:1204 length:411 start_codon:yes stop_codon:yes gene_type:complete